MRSGLGLNPVLSQPTSRGDDNEAAADGTCRCDVRGSKPDRDRAGKKGKDGEVSKDGEEKSREDEDEDGEEKGREDEKGRRQEEDGRQEVTSCATQARQGSLPAFFIYAPPFIPPCR